MLELVQVRDLSVVSLGKTVAIRVSLSPVCKDKTVLLSVTLEAKTGLTLTSQEATRSLWLMAEMVALPTPTAVTLPESETVAIEASVVV